MDCLILCNRVSHVCKINSSFLYFYQFKIFCYITYWHQVRKMASIFLIHVFQKWLYFILEVISYTWEIISAPAFLPQRHGFVSWFWEHSSSWSNHTSILLKGMKFQVHFFLYSSPLNSQAILQKVELRPCSSLHSSETSHMGGRSWL